MAIDFVGSATASKVGATSGNSTITLSSGLTGGTRAAVATGDLVVAIFATGSTSNRTLAITDGTNPYTLIDSELYSGVPTRDTNLRVACKFMGGTPDTTVTFGPTGSSDDAGTMAVLVYSGVDQTTPLDVAATSATGSGSAAANPPSITPTTSGAVVLAVGASASTTGAVHTSSDLTDFVSVTQADLNDSSLGVGYIAWTSGAVDPAAFGGGGGDANSSWAAMSIALRPAADSGIDIDADAGSYAVTGTAATLKRGRKAAADAGSYALTGSAASLTYGKKVAAAAGSYALSGQAAALKVARKVVAGAGSYALTGTAATLRRNVPLTAEAGAYSFTGNAASLAHGWKIVAVAGAYSLSGSAAALLRTWKATAGAGSYALTGSAAALTRNLPLVAGVGAYAFTGSAAALRHGWFVSAEAGSYALTGSDAAISTVANKAIAAGVGSYALTGAAASLLRSWYVTAGAGSYTISGSDAALTRVSDLLLDAESGSYLFSGEAAGLEITQPPDVEVPAGGGGGSYYGRLLLARRRKRELERKRREEAAALEAAKKLQRDIRKAQKGKLALARVEEQAERLDDLIAAQSALQDQVERVIGAIRDAQVTRAAREAELKIAARVAKEIKESIERQIEDDEESSLLLLLH